MFLLSSLQQVVDDILETSSFAGTLSMAVDTWDPVIGMVIGNLAK